MLQMLAIQVDEKEAAHRQAKKSAAQLEKFWRHSQYQHYHKTSQEIPACRGGIQKGVPDINAVCTLYATSHNHKNSDCTPYTSSVLFLVQNMSFYTIQYPFTIYSDFYVMKNIVK